MAEMQVVPCRGRRPRRPAQGKKSDTLPLFKIEIQGCPIIHNDKGKTLENAVFSRVLVLQRGLACICASREIGANKRICQCEHWQMKTPPGLSIMIRVPSRSDKKQTRQKAGLFFGAPAGTRTPDTLLKRQVLYRLSYWGMSSEHALLGFGFAKGLERHPPNRNPAKRFRFGKEEGTYGYGAFPALTETGEAEWSKFLLTWWLGWRDSNPLYRSQSPVCYHYTTSHRRRKPGPAPPASAF